MILDTTVLVDLLRGRKEAEERIRGLEDEGRLLWIPNPAVLELFEGIERADRPSEERRKVREVIESYTLIPLETDHARRAGTVSGRLVRRGRMLDPIDVQIAGVALVEDRAVLTRNAKHFERIPGLDVATY